MDAGRRPSVASRNAARPELHQLEVFLKVVETHTFSGAARLLNCTQPAVSQTIARLEEIYGADLFERRAGAPLTLTAVGEAILPSARILLETVDGQMVRAAQAARGRTRTLKLGFGAGLASIIADALIDLRNDAPDVHIELIEDETHALHLALEGRGLDIAIVAGPAQQTGPSLCCQALCENRLFAAIPADHPLARRRRISWRDLAAAPTIASASDGELIEHVLSACGAEPFAVDVLTVCHAALLNLVASSLGVALLFESAITSHGGVEFVVIGDRRAKVAVQALWRTDSSNDLRQRFLTHLSKLCAPLADRNKTKT